MGSRVALLFRFNDIRVSTAIMNEIGPPQYVHMYVDKSRLRLYIRACEWDADAFRVNRRAIRNTSTGYSMHSKEIMNMLFDLMKLENRDICIKCWHQIVDYRTIEVDLNDYRETDKHNMGRR